MNNQYGNQYPPQGNPGQGQGFAPKTAVNPLAPPAPVNYTQESARVNEPVNMTPFWKPSIGVHTVKFLTELEGYVYTDKKTGESRDNARIQIEEVANTPAGPTPTTFVWTMGKGRTTSSAYGQIVNFAMKHNGQLKGSSCTVAVKNNGTRTDFTII